MQRLEKVIFKFKICRKACAEIKKVLSQFKVKTVLILSDPGKTICRSDVSAQFCKNVSWRWAKSKL